jgi:hypothetical protein
MLEGRHRQPAAGRPSAAPDRQWALATLWIAGVLSLACAADSRADFFDGFDGPRVAPGWSTQSGDGKAQIRFSQSDGNGRIEVNASGDTRNIWWALIRHPLTPTLDARELARGDRELQIEARVRTHTVPRRINLHVNHTRTSDFHSHLREYDLDVAGRWQVITMTTTGFDASAADEVFVQLALMDWGTRSYALEIDYIKAQVVDPALANPDRGGPLPYRPAVAPPGSYQRELPVAAAASVDRAWPDTAGSWTAADGTMDPERLVVGPTALIVLRWDFSRIPARPVSGWGLLELATESVLQSESKAESFAELRLVELLALPPDWTGGPLSYADLLDDRPAEAVINEQPVIDVPPARPGAPTLLPVSPPVLDRLLSGQSRGLALMSHGGVTASFRLNGSGAPVLHFNLTDAATPADKGDPHVPDS